MEVIEVAGKLLGLAVADLGGGSAAVESASEDEDTCWSREGSGASYEGGASEDEDGVGGKRKRMSADDRKARNRERNRLHARKTRQRKKQHVQELQLKIWGLRQERQRLLQHSAEHSTAGVLLALSCSPNQCVQGSKSSTSPSTVFASTSRFSTPTTTPNKNRPSPQAGRDWSRELASHEEALLKITQEFESMDGGQQIGDDACCDESPAVVAGGGNGGGRGSGAGGKGSRGAKGTLADRTALRRERNRMHAKRTRNRKKLFVEACSVMIDKMKVENAKLEHEIRASGIPLPKDVWKDECQETIPEEPLPEYLAALWDFAEGKTHVPKTPPPGTGTAIVAHTPPATPTLVTTSAPTGWDLRQARSFSSCSSSSSSSSTSSISASVNVQTQEAAVTTSREAPSSPNLELEPGRPLSPMLEDASTLCAFMEAAQVRSAKRTRVRPATTAQQHNGVGSSGGQQQKQQQQGLGQRRVWSDHGSTTSESRGSSEEDEEAVNANEQKSSAHKEEPSRAEDGVKAEATASPAFWTSRQVLEQYILPRQIC